MLPIGPMLLMTVTSTSSAVGTVRLHLDECIPSRDLVSDLVSIELGFDRVVEGDASIEVRSACDGEFVRVSIMRDRPMKGARVVLDIAERRIALDDVRSEGGARLVALNIAELVNDTPVVAVAPPARSASPTVTAPIAAAPRDTLSLRLGAAPLLRYLPSPARVAVGMRASVGLDASPRATLPWTVSIDGGIEQSAGRVTLGEVRTRVISMAALGGLSWSASEDVALYAVGGVRGGWVWVDVTPNDDLAIEVGNGSGPWVGPMVGARIRYGGRMGVSLGLEGGWTTAGVSGGAGDTLSGLIDGWIGADLTIDWRLGDA